MAVSTARGSIAPGDTLTITIRGIGEAFLGSRILIVTTPWNETIDLTPEQWKSIPHDEIRDQVLRIVAADT